MQIENVDLAVVAAMLARKLEGHGVEGFVRGRTVLRDIVTEHFGCSEFEAEALIDTMVGRGFVRFTGDPGSAAGGAVWLVEWPRDSG